MSNIFNWEKIPPWGGLLISLLALLIAVIDARPSLEQLYGPSIKLAYEIERIYPIAHFQGSGGENYNYENSYPDRHILTYKIHNIGEVDIRARDISLFNEPNEFNRSVISVSLGGDAEILQAVSALESSLEKDNLVNLSNEFKSIPVELHVDSSNNLNNKVDINPEVIRINDSVIVDLVVQNLDTVKEVQPPQTGIDSILGDIPLYHPIQEARISSFLGFLFSSKSLFFLILIYSMLSFVQAFCIVVSTPYQDLRKYNKDTWIRTLKVFLVFLGVNYIYSFGIFKLAFSYFFS